jgi:plastocyanin
MATDPADGAWFGGQTTAEIPAGKTYTVTFSKAGTYEYTTGPFQPQMDGIIYVK